MQKVCRIDYRGELVPPAILRGKGSFYRTKDYKAARESLAWHYKAAYLDECKNDRLYRVDIQIFQPGAIDRKKWRRADIDNYVKPLLDAATGIIWKDDDQIVELRVKLERDAPLLQTKVIVYDVGYWHHYCVKIQCLKCGKEFEIGQAKAKLCNRRFCSTDCRSAYGWSTHVCLNCGKEFTSVKSAARGIRFCSRECYWSYRRLHPEEYR